jgi:hypothetical protein
MFIDFFHGLRRHGIGVTLQEWLTFLEALHKGLIRESVDDLYHVGRAVLVKHEAEYDLYDQVFLHTFGDAPAPPAVTQDVLDWLDDPILPRPLTPEERQRLNALQQDLEELMRAFEERLAQQKERHDGGSHWVGTGGTSPFGSGGFHPGGIRVGDGGGSMSARLIAAKRQFQNYRHDRVLDIRGLQIALKKLRRLKRVGQEEELDLDETVGATCRNGGDIELVFQSPRANEARLLLLMDAGGSMTPHARLVSSLFSAAHGLQHFKSFQHLYFHNCPYSTLFSDIQRQDAMPTHELLRSIDEDTYLVIVGDATMHPAELTEPWGAIDYWHHNETSGIEWLRRLRARLRHAVWLNPLREAWWNAPSLLMVRRLFPMYPLTVSGLEDAVEQLLQTRPIQ